MIEDYEVLKVVADLALNIERIEISGIGTSRQPLYPIKTGACER